MTTAEVFAENCKTVKRYLKPLLYNLNPIFIEAELVKTSVGKEYLIITRQDGEELPIDVTAADQAVSEIVKIVVNELF